MDALYGYALHLIRSKPDAEDLVQETFTKAFKSWHRYQTGTNCRAWLFRIMTNTFYNIQRAKKRRPQVEADALPEIELQVAEYAQGRGIYRPLEEQVLDGLISDHLQSALDSLGDDFRTVLLLADLQDFSYKEIAEVMDCPVGTVMSRLYRARRQMQRKLLGHAMEQGIVPRADRGTDVISLDAAREQNRRRQASK